MLQPLRVLVVGLGSMSLSHARDAVNSLRIVLAADTGIRKKRVVEL